MVSHAQLVAPYLHARATIVAAVPRPSALSDVFRNGGSRRKTDKTRELSTWLSGCAEGDKKDGQIETERRETPIRAVNRVAPASLPDPWAPGLAMDILERAIGRRRSRGFRHDVGKLSISVTTAEVVSLSCGRSLCEP